MADLYLKGVKVIDLSHLLPGPLATKLLQEMGAEIIKIEHPERPDLAKIYPPLVDDIGANYRALNTEKTVLELNYWAEEGKTKLIELVKTADVFVEQFRPGILAKYGLDFRSLSLYNPALVYVSITGYGQNGPNAKLAGHDLNYLALSGLLSLITDTKGVPVIPGIQLADIAGGSYKAVSSILSGLLHKAKTGLGSYHDISMTDGISDFLCLIKAQLDAGEQLYPGRKTLLSGYLPYYNVYQCSDNKFITLAALELKFWTAFCRMVNMEEWINLYLPLDENVAVLKKYLKALFLTKSSEEWHELGQIHDCCLTKVIEI